MNALRSILLTLCLCFLATACVSSQKPVGSRSGVKLDKKLWNATWRQESGFFRTRISDVTNRVVTVREEEKKEEQRLWIRKLGTLLIGNLQNDSTQAPTFTLFRVAITQNHLCLFPANKGTFEKLSAQGVLRPAGGDKEARVIPGISAAELRSLEKLEKSSVGFRLSDLFEADPEWVAIRVPTGSP